LCWNCGKIGHEKSECPNPTVIREESMRYNIESLIGIEEEESKDAKN